GRFATNWSAGATLALPPGHGYDVITTEALLERASARDGALVLPDGMTYRVLAVDLDEAQAPLAALRKVAELKKAGVPVVFGTRRPLRTPGFAAGDDEARRLGEELWAGSPTLAQALTSKGLAPDFEGPFEATHRRDGATDIYFVAGTGRAECVFRVSGRQPELWDPVRGTVDAETGWQTTGDGRTRLTLDLPQHGSVFVVFRREGSPGKEARKPAVPTSTQVLEGAWEVSFQLGRGAPEKAVFETLTDWTLHADSGIKYFSGTATYRKTFEVTAEQAARKAVLQLGSVAALARVRLNGKDLGIVWTAPWQAELTGALRAGRNELEIEVTNPWANRLIGDAGLPPEQRITMSNLQYEKGPRTIKAYQGYASEDALQPSGLVGPVKVELF
ncbi:MAG: glycosyl transferase family 2, partial [Verrucomicrobia bacterium]|nr:glycosyl transferase family 2 [Verrucomicrobiota bacterium]